MMFVHGRERPLSSVPAWVTGLVTIALLIHIGIRLSGVRPTIHVQDLPEPASPALLNLYAAGEPEILSALSMIWLQSFDNQPGVSLPLSRLHYPTLSRWLERISELDPRSRYPLFSACHIYARVNDQEKKRLIVQFVHRQFLKNPAQYWQWAAHSVILAKHQLKDLQLASRIAADIRRYTTADQVPHWARQMEIGLLESRGEYQDAALLIGGLLDSGEITNPTELRLLNQRLLELQDAERAAN